MGHVLSMVGYWIWVTCLPACRDCLGVTLDLAAFLSAEILALVSRACPGGGDKAACIAFLCYREAKPHHRREVLF